MNSTAPTATVNLDMYDHDALPWDAVVETLGAGTAENRDVHTVLGTVTPDGRPHAATVGALWIDGSWYVVSGSGTRKSRNLTVNPACTLTARIQRFDVVFTGAAHRVTDPAELARVAAVYSASGWPAEVAGGGFTAPYMAPSGGPGPWGLYRIACEEAVAVGTTTELSGATKWTFV